MGTPRLTNAGIQVEFTYADVHRLTNAGILVETDVLDKHRLTNAGILVETDVAIKHTVTSVVTVIETKNVLKQAVTSIGTLVETKNVLKQTVTSVATVVEWKYGGTSNKSAYIHGLVSATPSHKDAYIEGGLATVRSNFYAYAKGLTSGSASHSAYATCEGALQQPVADVTVNSWVNEVSSPVLYSSLNEIDFNDATYVTKPSVQVNDYFEVSCTEFESGWVPTGDHYIEFRGWGTGATITVKIELRLGGTSIASRTQVLTSTAEGYSFMLTPQETDAIIDAWSSVIIRVTVTGIA